MSAAEIVVSILALFGLTVLSLALTLVILARATGRAGLTIGRSSVDDGLCPWCRGTGKSDE